MLTLLFNRFPKRRPVGLLALGEWGPASGAISGAVATEQTQQSLGSGDVSVPVTVFAGGGGGGGALGSKFYPRPVAAVSGQARTSQRFQHVALASASLGFSAEAATGQQAQVKASGVQSFVGAASSTLVRIDRSEASGTLGFRGQAASEQEQRQEAVSVQSFVASVASAQEQQPEASSVQSFVASASVEQEQQQAAASGVQRFAGAAASSEKEQRAEVSGVQRFVGTLASAEQEQRLEVLGTQSFAGSASSANAAGTSSSEGDMIDTELELMFSIIQAA